ncbi:YceI family protein [Gorillibacterium sp. sgz5001074]|uniref:YceI family protein n=1 Tax=Gorillibacterium sp. sgz5001074 TaxID=3446695 RepID=UPI003F663BC5
MKGKWIALAAGIVLAASGGGYAAYDYYAGNHVEVKEVIAAQAVEGSAAGKPVEAAAVNGTWSIQSGSEVYFSVTTSKETVNFVGKSVTGSWKLNISDTGANAAEGKVEMTSVGSGNSQRDNHIKGKDYLAVEQFPEAVFTAKSFGNLPREWKEGETISVPISGTLTIKGLTKEVTFDSKVQMSGGQLKLEGSTVVTFMDFGMKNPHTVVLNTENDVKVQLRLLLGKGASA